MIELITTCPWLAYASIIRRRRPSSDSPALRFGGFIHQVLDYRYRAMGLGIEWTEEAMVALATDLFTKSPLEHEGWRNLDTAVKVIRGYNAHYTAARERFTIAMNPQGQPYVEQPFACDTHRTLRGHRIIYTGKIDRKIHEAGMTLITDSKTSSKLGDDTWAEWAMAEQFRGYCWADRECTGKEPTGYLIDAIGVRKSIANSVFNEITSRVEPLNGKSKAVPLELMRQPFFISVPPGQLDEWFENMLQQVDQFLALYEKCGEDPHLWNTHRHHRHCVGKYDQCQFYNVCSLPTEEGREDALMSGAFKDNEWSPLFH
jgi:hypothetical protein